MLNIGRLMAERIALVGFVNTEEILADTIARQSPGVQIDGYEVLPNEAFGRIVTNRTRLYGVDGDGEFGVNHLDRLDRIHAVKYDSVNLGPDAAVHIASAALERLDVDYIGPRLNELEIEQDKTAIHGIFPNDSGIMPPTRIFETPDMTAFGEAIDDYGDVIVKFVGEYSDFYEGSESRRVRRLSEFEDRHELEEFLKKSVEAGGSVIVQKYIEGEPFSSTCLVDGNEGIFSLGENYFYKNRHEGNTGPLCDGTGSVAVNNTLPDMLGPEDLEWIQKRIVSPYVAYLGERFGRLPKTFLNLDFVMGLDGRPYLLEINNRQPGGHTMSTLLTGLETPLVEAMQATSEGRLDELMPTYKPGASVVVTAFPKNTPYAFASEEDKPIITVPKNRPEDEVRIYTGWVNLLRETPENATVQSELTATLIFANHANTVKRARANVYKRLGEVVGDNLAFRRDIGSRYVEY